MIDKDKKEVEDISDTSDKLLMEKNEVLDQQNSSFISYINGDAKTQM